MGTFYRPIQVDGTDGRRYTIQRDVQYSHTTVSGVRVGTALILGASYLVREQERIDLTNLRLCDHEGRYIRVEFDPAAFNATVPLSYQQLNRAGQVAADRERWAAQEAATKNTQEGSK